MKKSKLDPQIQLKLDKLKRFRLLDDTFMSKVFESKECVELLLRIILGIPDLVVIECRTQYELKNLHGRSIRLDIYARSGNRYFNIEIQRSSVGALPRRARYHSALVDADVLEPGEAFEQLPESYVIFITENDVFGKGRPIYLVNRMIEGINEPFNDGSHIVYVNAQNVNKKTDLGKLMADFHCTQAEEMNYPVLAKRVKYLKEETKGVNVMCQIMEEIREEGKTEGEVKMIKRTMKNKKMTFEEAMAWFEIPAKDQRKYAKLMGGSKKLTK